MSKMSRCHKRRARTLRKGWGLTLQSTAAKMPHSLRLETKSEILSLSAHPSPKKKGNKNLSKRGVPMREEFFSKIGWTRSFISGPVDPLHNPHMVWCHNCKKNFSINSKGPYEILRHHRTELHLRRDQRWRYEHLQSTYPVTGKVQHRVRGDNGKLLSKVEQAKELTKFIHVELVDIGERFPFYEDFVKGSTTALVTPEARTKTQLCLVGDFIKAQGDLIVLRNLWSRMGSFTNHQATFNDFDWGEERLSVSTVHFNSLGSVLPRVSRVLVSRRSSIIFSFAVLTTRQSKSIPSKALP